jgi:hypothetical protein
VSELSEVQRATLRAVCDTVVPSLHRSEDPDGFWARKATDVGADQALLATLLTLPEDQAAGLLQLLDALAQQGFGSMAGSGRRHDDRGGRGDRRLRGRGRRDRSETGGRRPQGGRAGDG